MFFLGNKNCHVFPGKTNWEIYNKTEKKIKAAEIRSNQQEYRHHGIELK